MLHAGGGQFNGERQSIQMGTDGGHGTSISVGHREIRLHGLSPLDEKSHRLVVRESLEIRELFQGRHRQRRHGELVLGSHMQPHTAGHHYFQPGAGNQQFGQHHGGFDDLLEVVQQKEHLFLFQEGLQQRDARPSQCSRLQSASVHPYAAQ